MHSRNFMNVDLRNFTFFFNIVGVVYVRNTVFCGVDSAEVCVDFTISVSNVRQQHNKIATIGFLGMIRLSLSRLLSDPQGVML